MVVSEAWHRPRRVTLDDVAREAQVSRALVSIVMREAPGASPATRERVLAAARDLGYRPDVRARSLASRKSRLLGVMFGVGVGTFHFDLLERLYDEAERQGHNLILSALTRGRDERRAAQSLQDFRFDALIMLGPPTTEPLLAGKVPVVVVGWHVDHPAVDVVRVSDERGMALAVDHLVGLGHRRITHIDGGSGPITASRRDGYVTAMRAHGLDGQVRVVPGGQTQLDGHRAARLLLDVGELPTAVVAYNDDVAVAAMGLLAQQGVAVPDRVSVVGWDDSEAAGLSSIGLTSIAQPVDAMARSVVTRILARIDGRRIDDREVVLEPGLTVRSSTSTAASRMS